LTQFASNFNVAFVNQNGSLVGQLNDINVDSDGFVIASFSNGQTQRIFKVPVATFADPNSLRAETGNAYTETDTSGSFNLREAGTGGAGNLVPSALEGANVDIAKEFTNMIVTQRAFSANTRVITTADEMLEELIRLG
jgi:flagellar hook protein FlgE